MGNFENFNQAAPVPEQPQERGDKAKPKKMGVIGSALTAAALTIGSLLQPAEAEENKTLGSDEIKGQKTEQTESTSSFKDTRKMVSMSNFGSLASDESEAYDPLAEAKPKEGGLSLKGKSNFSGSGLVPASQSELLEEGGESWSASGKDEKSVDSEAAKKAAEAKKHLKSKTIDFTRS